MITRPVIKVCGMREAGNIRLVEAAGADWMGFIFYPPSPRYVSRRPDYLPACRRVGVFVDADEACIREHVARFGLQSVQLHGHESPDLCRRLRDSGVHVIKAFHAASPCDLLLTTHYERAADTFLFDTPCAGHGGSGRRFDWQLLHAYTGRTPFLLSGGIGPDCLDALAAFSHPRLLGYDLNSGFETAPAIKDAETLRTFIQAIKKTAS